MGEPRVLKGLYKDGPAIASVILQDTKAKIMVKGIEPKMPRDSGFVEGLRKVAAACKEPIANFSEREMCVVLVQSPAMAEHFHFTPEDLNAMGVTKVTAMDGDSGMVVRVVENDPPPLTLAYTSLRAGSGDFPDQPGLVEIATAIPRKTYKQLTPPQQQLFGVIIQVTGRALMKFVILEDEGLRATVTLTDLPPPRARSVMVPFGKLADELAKGATVDSIAAKMGPIRGS